MILFPKSLNLPLQDSIKDPHRMVKSPMIIAGLQKTSLIDYPGKLSCVLFSIGCNFECPYCHNPGLVKQKLWKGPYLSNKTIHAFLSRRKGLLDGVVISGGEPTLQEDLTSFCEEIKQMGFLLKLDTNGSRPKVIKSLIEEGFVDYLAMDIKTAPFQYCPVITRQYDPGQILWSIQLIMESSLPYEFRTTCVKPIVDERIIEVIAKTIKGGSRYVLQRFCNHEVLNPDYFEKQGSPIEEHELLHLKSVADPWVNQCIVR